MPWRVEYHRDQEIVEAAYWGDTDAAAIRDATREAIKLVKQHEATLGLVDCLEQTSTGSILELYELPQLYDDEGLTRSIRIALVEPAKRELKDLAMFYENVCVNRGWQLRRFATRDDAVAWLRLPG